MAVRLLKELMSERLNRVATIKFPMDVSLSYCKTQTNSYLIKTPHGVVRVTKVTEV